ncbi:lipopolysaccharide biosynthesis protein [uncultured Acinetobacter sp.]|uniref:lipopolysaccharide biosynthesis protein n=1 Tax=uncultured Acinetobacter sp. TaxID=165433 RepID=UPI002582B4A0|nr:lipopolysaccharide biosynthesis protein [uncultured Acinetobacter sp.]
MKSFLNFFNNTSVFKRLLKGVGANTLGKVWVMLIQFLSIYFLNKSWGIEGYGLWLMISTIPTYLALSDFGLGTAATIRMTKALAENNYKDAVKAFQSVWLFVSASTLFIFFIGLLIGWGWISYTDSLKTYSNYSYLVIFQTVAVMGLSTLLAIQMSLFKAIYQANNKYAIGTLFFDLASLFEGLIVILIAINGGNILHAAFGMLFVRVLFTIHYIYLVVKNEDWFSLGFNQADVKTLKELARPSIAALSLTLANSFGIQGVVLTIGWTLGPAVAGVFSATRMLTRIPLQIPSLLMRASIPELTRAYVQRDKSLLDKLMSLNIRLALLVVIPSTCILFILGPWLLNIMSDGNIKVGYLDFIFLGMAAIFCTLWNTYGMQLLSINRQGDFSWFVILAYFICCFIPIFVINYEFVLFLLSVFELFILFFVMRCVQRVKYNFELQG